MSISTQNIGRSFLTLILSYLIPETFFSWLSSEETTQGNGRVLI